MESNKIIYIKQDGFDFAFIEVSEEYIKRQQEQLSKNPYRCGLLEEGETFDLLPEQEYLGKWVWLWERRLNLFPRIIRAIMSGI